MNIILDNNFSLFKNVNNNLFLAKYNYKLLRKNLSHFKKIDFKEINCSFCKSVKIKSYFKSISKPENNISFLSKKLFDKFYFRSIGQCSECGLLQDYNRLNKSEFINFIKEMTEKDKNYAPENNFTSFPVPEKIKEKFYKNNYEKRFIKWRDKIIVNNNENILFLRPHFGIISKFFNNQKKVNLYYNDFSNINKKVIKLDYPNMKYLQGHSHHIFEGEFLKENFFDTVIFDHTLCHALDIDDYMKKIQLILKQKGRVLFLNEIQVKTHNPFHLNFYDENMFIKILSKYFNVEVIRDCGYDNNQFINNFTNKNDNPDFLCIKK